MTDYTNCNYRDGANVINDTGQSLATFHLYFIVSTVITIGDHTLFPKDVPCKTKMWEMRFDHYPCSLHNNSTVVTHTRINYLLHNYIFCHVTASISFWMDNVLDGKVLRFLSLKKYQNNSHSKGYSIILDDLSNTYSIIIEENSLWQCFEHEFFHILIQITGIITTFAELLHFSRYIRMKERIKMHTCNINVVYKYMTNKYTFNYQLFHCICFTSDFYLQSFII